MNDQNIQQFIERLEFVCGKYADKAAITYLRSNHTKEDFSFREILERVQAARGQFARIGLRPGDRVAIIAPHTPFTVMAGFALAYANITTVLIDAALPPEEMNRLLAFSDVHAVFTTPAKYEVMDQSACDGISVFNLLHEAREYKAFPGSAKSVTRPATVDPDLEIIAILFSSGTTASMKGIMIPYKSVEISRPMFHRLTDSSDNINILFAYPFNHVAGFFVAFQHFLSGCGLGMIEEMDSIKLTKAFHDYQPDFFALVPKFYEIVIQKIRQTVHDKGIVTEKMFYLLLGFSRLLRKNFGINVGKYLFKSVLHQVFGERLFGLGTGGAMCRADTASFFLDLGIGIWANFYALTETYVPAIVTGIFDRYPAGTEGKAGRFDGIDVKIHAPDENGVGEVRIKTILIMKGYFREPEQTVAAFDGDGYFITGDLGYIDRKSYLHITGRIKEAIHMQTGKKVAPSDVDSFYGGILPNVAIASCGVPGKDEAFDEIHLFIESGSLSADGQQEIKKTVTDFSAQTSTLYKISGVHFIDKLPVTSVGKVKRYLLKEAALAKRPASRESSEPGITGGNTESLVLNIITRHAEGQTVTLDSRLEHDLGIDSLTMMEICVNIEGALNTLIAESMGTVETVRDIVTLIESGGASRDVEYNIEDYPLPKKISICGG
jgi:long-chain acyl-CoA synthetase